MVCKTWMPCPIESSKTSSNETGTGENKTGTWGVRSGFQTIALSFLMWKVCFWLCSFWECELNLIRGASPTCWPYLLSCVWFLLLFVLWFSPEHRSSFFRDFLWSNSVSSGKIWVHPTRILLIRIVSWADFHWRSWTSVRLEVDESFGNFVKAQGALEVPFARECLCCACGGDAFTSPYTQRPTTCHHTGIFQGLVLDYHGGIELCCQGIPSVLTGTEHRAQKTGPTPVCELLLTTRTKGQ